MIKFERFTVEPKLIIDRARSRTFLYAGNFKLVINDKKDQFLIVFLLNSNINKQKLYYINNINDKTGLAINGNTNKTLNADIEPTNIKTCPIFSLIPANTTCATFDN